MAMQTMVVTIMISSMVMFMLTTINVTTGTGMTIPTNTVNHTIMIMHMISQPKTITRMIMLMPNRLTQTSPSPRA
jgi:hypothetical protein